MEQILTIRQMCDTFKVTARTLRFYEDKELIKPIREGQKRLYTRREMTRVKLILRGKRLGFSLEQIRELLDLYYLGDKQKTQIQRTYNLGLLRLDEMLAQRTDLDDAIKELKERLQAGADWLERSDTREIMEA